MKRFFAVFILGALLIFSGGANVYAAIIIPDDVTKYESLLSGDIKVAKNYLKSKLNRTGRTTCATDPFTVDNSIDPLNPAFALCAANFLRAYEANVAPIQISSAFRSPAQQKCVCPTAVAGRCGAPGVYNASTRTVVGGSNHQRGIALDINTASYTKLHAFARANPSFGVTFPLPTKDAVHMQPVSKTDPKCVTQNHQINIPTEGYENVVATVTGYNPAPVPQTSAQTVTQSLTQQLFASLFNRGSSSSGGASTQTPSVFFEDGDFSTTTVSVLGEDLVPLEEVSFIFPDSTAESGEVPVTSVDSSSEPLGCENSGLPGTKEFETCKTEEDTPTRFAADGVSTTVEQTTTRRLVDIVPDFLAGGGDDVYFFDDEGSSRRVVSTSGGVEIFYDVHDPSNTGNSPQERTSGEGFVNSTQFLAGEVRAVVRETPSVITNSAQFAQWSVLFGAYYGLVHSISPMIVGSAPRTFIRLGQGSEAANVYNPFSI